MPANISFFRGIFGASFTTRQDTFSFVSFKAQCYHIGQFVEDSVYSLSLALHIKSSFPLRISSVNVTESAGNWGFDHIYWRNSEWKTSFFVQCGYNISKVTVNYCSSQMQIILFKLSRILIIFTGTSERYYWLL